MNFGTKHGRDEDDCEAYRVDNLRVEAPDALFREYDSESFDGPQGSYGGVVFNDQGHAIKFARSKMLLGDEEPYNTCIASKRGYAPEFYDAWKVKDNYDDEYYAIDMEKYDITLYDYIHRPANPADDADVDASLADVVTQMSHERACHYDLHCLNTMLKRNGDGHYIVKAIDWMRSDFGAKVCERPLFFDHEMEQVLGGDAFKSRFPKTRQAVIDKLHAEDAAWQKGS